MFSSICFQNLKKNPITLQIHIISVISIDTAPCIVKDLKDNFFVRLDKFWIITLLCKVTLVFFSGYHDIPWAFQALLKLEKKFYSRTWAGWQHPDDKWSEAVLATDITQKITNGHEQHKLPNNLKWTRVIRKGKQFLPIAIHLCVSIIKSGRTLMGWLLFFVSVLPWFIFCPRLLFFYNPSRAMAIS
jgi:hypothetical protein